MTRIAPLLVLVGAAALSGCGDMSPEEVAKNDATLACLVKAGELFPMLASLPDAEDDNVTEEFAVDEAGQFKLLIVARLPKRPLSESVGCRGNINSRSLESVEFNGVAKRPAEQEGWNY